VRLLFSSNLPQIPLLRNRLSRHSGYNLAERFFFPNRRGKFTASLTVFYRTLMHADFKDAEYIFASKASDPQSDQRKSAQISVQNIIFRVN
jgi:hypothetical protein